MPITINGCDSPINPYGCHLSQAANLPFQQVTLRGVTLQKATFPDFPMKSEGSPLNLSTGMC